MADKAKSTRRRKRAGLTRAAGGLLMCIMSATGCGGPAVDGAPPGFPDVRTWGAAVAVVHDDEARMSRQIFRAPDGQSWAKVHHPLRQLAITTRIDVRRLTPGDGLEGWQYTSWDPARRTPLKADAQACFLCHSMAPRNGTYSRVRR